MSGQHCAIFASAPEDAALLMSFAYFRGKWKVGSTYVYNDLIRLLRDVELEKFEVVIFKNVSAIAGDIVTLSAILDRLWKKGIRVIVYEGRLDSEDAGSLKEHVTQALRQSEYYNR